MKYSIFIIYHNKHLFYTLVICIETFSFQIATLTQVIIFQFHSEEKLFSIKTKAVYQ